MTLKLCDRVLGTEYDVKLSLDGTQITIGRDGDVKLRESKGRVYGTPDNQIEKHQRSEKLKRVSNEHFSFSVDADGNLVLKDLSLNGTAVNGRYLEKGESVVVDNADMVTAGGKHTGRGYNLGVWIDGGLNYRKSEESRFNRIRKDVKRFLQYFVCDEGQY